MIRNFSIAFALMSVLACGESPAIHAGSGGPLFVQVHFTSEITGITGKQLARLLAGDISDFSSRRGRSRPVRLYVDAPLADILKTKYPKCGARSVSFDSWNSLAADRSFLGVSDVRGVRPYFRYSPWTANSPGNRR